MGEIDIVFPERRPFRLDALRFSSALPVLVLAPHPDDFDAIGVTLRHFCIKDPKTVDMRIDAYMPFAVADADWKATLLRFHDSQQQRSLHTRGHGFDVVLDLCSNAVRVRGRGPLR